MTGCEALVGAALFACLARDPACLPPQHMRHYVDLAAIAQQESRFHPWAIRDERTKESLFPLTRQDAEREAARRMARGHTLGIGLGQITGLANLARHGLTPATMFDPCLNMQAMANHYAADYAASERAVRAGAFNLYNSGSLTGSPAYAAQTLGRADALTPQLRAERAMPGLATPPQAPSIPQFSYGRTAGAVPDAVP